MSTLNHYLFTLPNGFTTLFLPMNNATSVATNLSVNVGSRFETPKTAGIAHYLEHIISNKTEAWKDKLYLERMVESQGMYRNAYTWSFITAYWFEGKSTDLEQMLEFSRQIYFHSQLDEESVEAERGIITEEWKMGWDDPSGFADVLVSKAALGDHPLGMSTIGTKESIAQLAYKDFITFYDTYYNAQNALLVVAGAFDEASLKARIAELFGSYEPGTKRSLNTYVDNQKKAVVVYGQRDVPYTIYYCAQKFPGPRHADWWAINVLAAILADGKAALYQHQLIDEQKVITDFSFGWHPNEDISLALTEFIVSNDKQEESLKAIMNLWQKLKSGQGIEVERAKQVLITSMALDLEEPSSLCDTVTQFYHVTGKVFDFTEVADTIAAVTLDDVVHVAQTYLVPERITLSVVSSHEPQLQTLERIIQSI